MQAAVIGQLVSDPHLGVQAPLLGHVAEPGAIRVTDAAAVPADLSGVQSQQAEDGPHGRGLACAVAAQEPEHAAGLHGERAPVEGGDVAVALVEVVDLQHEISLRVVGGC